MSPQRFRVEEVDLSGEGVSGIMDERPKLDSGRHAAALRSGLGRPTHYQRCRNVNGSAALGFISNHVTILVRNSRVLKPGRLQMSNNEFGLNGLRKNSGPGRKDVPQGLKRVCENQDFRI